MPSGIQRSRIIIHEEGLLGKYFLLYLLICALFLPQAKAFQDASEYVWGNVKIGGGGFVTGIIMSDTEKDLIYARTDVGGAYRWVEEEQYWKPLLDWTSRSQTSYQGVESLAIDPQSPNKLYLSVGTEYWNNGTSAILCSDDYGETFTIVNVTSQFRIHGNGMGRQTGEKLAVDPNAGNILFCGTRNHGLFRSADAGRSWEKVTAFPALQTGSLTNNNGISAVVFDPESGQDGIPTPRIFVAVSRTGNDNLFVSEDAGITWLPVEGATQSLMPHRLKYSQGNLYITYTSHSGPWDIEQNRGALYRYDIELKQWQDISPVANTPFGGIGIAKSDPDRLVVATINRWHAQNWVSGQTAWGDRLYYSTNGGASWLELFAGNRMSLATDNLWDQTMALHWTGSVEIDPFNSNRVFAVSGNGIFATNNLDQALSGRSAWRLQCDGLEETVPLNLISIPQGPLISVIGDYDGFVHHDASQVYKRHRPSIGSSSGLDYAGLKTSFSVRSGGSDQTKLIFYSENTGATWLPFASKPAESARSGHVAVSANGSFVIWKPDGVSNTYFTTDKGSTWKEVHTTAQSGRPVSDKQNDNIFYSFTGSTLNIFTYNANTGQFDRATKNIGASGSNLIRPAHGRSGDVWIACGNSGLRRYKHHSDELIMIQGVQACQAVGFGKEAPTATFPAVYIWGTVSGTEGIFRSDDEGLTWIRINDDNHQYGGPGNGNFILGDANIFGRVYMSTVGRGIVMGSLKNDQTGIDIVHQSNNKHDRNQGVVFSHYLLLTRDTPDMYTIYDMSGALREQGRLTNDNLIGSDLIPGMYVMVIFHPGSIETMRLLKTH